MANKFKCFRGKVDGGTPTIIVPQAGMSNATGDSRDNSSTAIVHALFLSNIDATQEVMVDIDIYNPTYVTPNIIGKDIPIPAGSTLFFEKPVNLEENDTLRITTASSNDVDAVASTLTITAA